jgi:hypothetical protein
VTVAKIAETWYNVKNKKAGESGCIQKTKSKIYAE